MSRLRGDAQACDLTRERLIDGLYLGGSEAGGLHVGSSPRERRLLLLSVGYDHDLIKHSILLIEDDSDLTGLDGNLLGGIAEAGDREALGTSGYLDAEASVSIRHGTYSGGTSHDDVSCDDGLIARGGEHHAGGGNMPILCLGGSEGERKEEEC